MVKILDCDTLNISYLFHSYILIYKSMVLHSIQLIRIIDTVCIEIVSWLVFFKD